MIINVSREYGSSTQTSGLFCQETEEDLGVQTLLSFSVLLRISCKNFIKPLNVTITYLMAGLIIWILNFSILSLI